ncbi:MAG: HlyD family efflux transporter periplasmic adaptor subunit, partial [Hymenobacteraceae bacterium]|nr:HlyD family efflux transporter periplasmic adaptor subunit [Hymenobacteraceae bacterium]
AAEQEYRRVQSIADIAARKDVISAELRLRQARQNAALAAGQTQRVRLTAPISGTVDVFSLAAGQQVTAGDELLRVINPGRLAVEAQVFADDRAAVTGAAQFRIEPLAGEAADAGSGAPTPSVPARLVTFSNVVNPTNQAQQLVLTVADSGAAAGGALRVGQRVQVRVQTRGATPQVVVPTSAITDVNGQPAIFLHTAPEVFTLRFVRLGAGDERQTAIEAGLAAGERVVTTNTYQLKSVYLNQ